MLPKLADKVLRLEVRALALVPATSELYILPSIRLFPTI